MLNKNQLSSLQRDLEARKKDLEHRLEINNHLDIERAYRHESTGELSLYDNHPADAGTELYEREKDIALLDHYEKELKDINYALSKIADGSYGKCELCNKEIPFERLKALPTTTFCIEHTQEQIVSHSRPVEEGVLLPPFGKFEYDEKDATFFDAEDSWQDVGKYGTSETPSDFFDPDMDDYNEMFIEEDESVGFVEDIESFIGTDINGKNMQVYPNDTHEKYEERLDEENVMSVTGNLGAEELEFDKD